MKHEIETDAGFFDSAACDLNAFTALIDQTADASTVPNADDIQKNVPIYDMSRLRPSLEDKERRRTIMAEWARVLQAGAGVLVLREAYADTVVLDEATAIYEQIIASEKLASGGGGDHFAASGSNDRIWNSLQKLCEEAPDVFLRYFANTSITTACEAWLGPNYQMTAQINLVHPGGAAQQAHRDYHLGFQTAEISAEYPAHVHDLSPALTLQGAVAHCDMPVESGPTKLLPFSQLYRAGYAAWRRDDFRALFEERYIQLPLAKGDALFFNPALFHAAGANTSSDVHRMANLLQVSSAFGRAMETVDRDKMCKLLYPHALAAHQNSTLGVLALEAAIAATAEGYSFPTNLDRDPPKDGLAPETQQALFSRSIVKGLSAKEFVENLDKMRAKQLA
ncbi:ectoine hydroxylase-related dioxygenase (phytanoyl-CoA dioxygenase family) [Litoreibacter halocynthiae]|uniref:Ectoine hydroxylase-related dioxygenase (Phytanoyl-CoA dioxygenase family) n=1 Tax=Litoreibacter halocynthiae TaxID=1242689 RepID=A0A4R7LMS7_9RHOB|nr:phytanoyl-CoA dioxygenase family protein [Litoreibacter halocynthiae]TDT77318.1 ectoine hydroxylase-related dioxygenase (phytanoyl-CoA dioxygenase family) [Litoreibacter halocynthiae]